MNQPHMLASQLASALRENGFDQDIDIAFQDDELHLGGRVQAEAGSMMNLVVHEFLQRHPEIESVNRERLSFFRPRPAADPRAPVPKLSVPDDELVEYSEQPDVLRRKIRFLCDQIRGRGKGRFVVYTGAGISTAAKIPDFRGPKGVWTCRDRGLPGPKSIRMEQATPTFAHNCLVGLQNDKVMTYLVSQNVDGLHRRSGIHADMISELHGNCYIEICANPECAKEYLRHFDVCNNPGPHFARSADPLSKSGISHITGRKCDACGGMLRDSIIHFTENLPEEALKLGITHSRKARVALCIGTSLHVTPAADLPEKCALHGGILFIANLQATGRDEAALKSGGVLIHEKCDLVMALLMEELGYDVKRNIVTGAPVEEGTAEQETFTFARQFPKAEEKVATVSSSAHSAAKPAAPVIPSTLYVGNTHAEVADEVSLHDWTMFVSSSPSSITAPFPADLVTHVEYELHPTFRPNRVVVDRPPFQLERRGWGTFPVRCTIHYNQAYGAREPTQISHMISFEKPLSTSPFAVPDE